MSEAVLDKLVKDYMQTGFDVLGFAWQGGEPTLMGVDFFKRAVELQKRHGKAGQQVSNTMQTNGVLLDESWCRFLHDNKFLLGISIDGPRRFHDTYRVDHSGAGTYERVIRAIDNCKRHGVEFNALVLLNDQNVEHPQELFEFLLEHDLTYVQFIPCIELDRASGEPAEFSITAEQYGEFLCRLFDLWHAHGPNKMNVREFDSLITYYVLGNHTICTYSRQCAGFVVVEHTGDAFCCEFFVEPRWRLGNILETPLVDLANSPVKREFARQKNKLCTKCLICNCLEICRGGCLKDRVRSGLGDLDRPSFFCQSYKRFFDHALPRVMQLAAAIKAGSAGRRTRPAEKVRLQIR